jgi:adenosyl cobinamide kinase/adenosyl cobinamide phosphate guanylyltransferase
MSNNMADKIKAELDIEENKLDIEESETMKDLLTALDEKIEENNSILEDCLSNLFKIELRRDILKQSQEILFGTQEK